MNTNRTPAAGDRGALTGSRPSSPVMRMLTLLVALLSLVAPFLGAGRLRWRAAWLYIGLTTIGGMVGRVLMLRVHPELAAERSGFVGHEGTKSWDRIIAPLVILGPAVLGFVAGLNHRFGWPPRISRALQALAIPVVVASLGFASWAMISNPFFSSVVRVQSERGHHAIATGPYRFVRHPAYAATIPAQFAFALMLGSAWALVPAGVVAALVVLRTALEDRALQAELPGYGDYAAQVRYRLFPGIW